MFARRRVRPYSEPDIFHIYRNEAGGVPSIDEELEKKLWKRVKDAKDRIGKLNELFESGLSEKERKLALAELGENKLDFTEARNELILVNLRLVIFVARERVSSNPGFTLLDLIQMGNFGLMSAVEHFDPERGNKFSTYAVRLISRTITREIYQTGRTIRVPVYLREKLWCGRKPENDLGISPTAEEIARTVKISKGLAAIFMNLPNTVPFSAPIGDGTFTLEDSIRDEGPSPLDILLERERLNHIQNALAGLTPIERQVISLRAQGLTLEAIGELRNVSRKAIWQTEKRALGKLKKQISRRRWTGC